jgi:hypothetical protein
LETPTTTQTPKITKKNNSSLLIDSTDTIKVAKYCLDEETEKAEYEKVLNNPALQIFRDEFVYDKLGHPQIVVWYYDNSN